MSVELQLVEAIDLGFDTNLVADALEARFIDCDQVDIPVRHSFSPGEYRREITIPAGTLIIGHKHLTSHWNILHRGRASIVMNGQRKEVKGPMTFWSEAGTRKIAYVHEEVVFETIHETSTIKIEDLEDELCEKTEVWKKRFGPYIDWIGKREVLDHYEAVEQHA